MLIYVGTSAQYKQMLNKPYKDKVGDINILYWNVVEKDSTSAFAYIKEFENWAIEHQDYQLVLEAQLLRAYYYRKYAWDDPEKLNYLIEIAEKGRIENIPHIEERAVQAIAVHYWRKENYQKAFEWMLLSAKILDKMEPASFPNMAEHLNLLGRYYYFFNDYNSALIYYEKSSNLPMSSFNALAVIEAQNTLGLCYQKLGNLNKAAHWFQKVIDDTSSYQSAVWKGIASGNLGYTYYLKHDYERAIPLFKIDIENALMGKVDYGLAAGSTIPLADIYLKQNKLEESKRKIDESRRYIRLSSQTDRLRKLYPVMSKWYAKNNRPDSSAVYLDSAMLATKKHNEKYNSLKLLRANQEVEAKDRELEVSQLKTESRLKLSQRNFVIIIVVLLLGGSILAYLLRNKYLLEKQRAKDLALKDSQKALVDAKNQLETLVQKVHLDNQVITQLKKGEPQNKDITLLERLKSKSILTNDDWIQYQELFKKVYPKFIPNLKSSYPDLSPAERRCLCLEKLRMSNNEMALVLGVSANTVIVTKHRIRKKLGIKSQNELQDFIQGLN